MKVTESQTFLEIMAGRAAVGYGGHKLDVYVNGQLLEKRGWEEWKDKSNIIREDLLTARVLPGQFASRKWGLGGYAGQEIDLEVAIEPQPSPDGGPLPGVMLGLLSINGVVWNLADFGGNAPVVDVPLTSLKPAAVELPEGHQWLPGKLTNGKDLRVVSYPIADGFGMATGSSVTYVLDPKWKKFTTFIGFGEESVDHVGHFEILLDDELVWESSRFGKFTRRYRACQTVIDIPAGKKTLTLRLGASENPAFGAWGHPGFITEEAK
jgi:hypothetical protein